MDDFRNMRSGPRKVEPKVEPPKQENIKEVIKLLDELLTYVAEVALNLESGITKLKGLVDPKPPPKKKKGK